MAKEEGFFDELARGLADGSITRGKALRLMGAALVGGTLGSLGIGEAGADPPGCKRIGKHCTRDTQCCGSLVCLSGTCQTPTTTTTETPSTTTSTPCLPNGGNCTPNGQCCSGACQDGVCLPPGGGNFIECFCVDTTAIPSFCTSAGCDASDVEQVCVALCAPSGGLEIQQCTPCSTACPSCT
jgi:hypothetical protein